MAPVPSDDRGGAAGLFGIRAPRSWHGVALKVGGTARRLDSGRSAGEASSVVALTRWRELASTLELDGVPVQAPGPTPDDPDRPAGPGTPQGLMIDSLHRILGLPSPGDPVCTPVMATTLWLSDLLQLVFERGSLTWADAVHAHPLLGADAGVPPSVETVIETTCRATKLVNWQRLHSRAVAADEPSAGLTPAELSWMDATMFSRWVLSSFPDPLDVIEILVELGCDRTAARLSEAVTGIMSRLSVDGSATRAAATLARRSPEP